MSLQSHRLLIPFLAILIVIFGCNVLESDETEKPKYKAIVKPDHQTRDMINKVEEAYETIDPERVNYILNGKKAKLLQNKLDQMEPGNEMNLVLYDYAEELLRAGRVTESIVIFKDFLNFFKDQDIMAKKETLAEFSRKLAVCYMRKAELENCVNNHNNESSP